MCDDNLNDFGPTRCLQVLTDTTALEMATRCATFTFYVLCKTYPLHGRMHTAQGPSVHNITVHNVVFNQYIAGEQRGE